MLLFRILNLLLDCEDKEVKGARTHTSGEAKALINQWVTETNANPKDFSPTKKSDYKVEPIKKEKS